MLYRFARIVVCIVTKLFYRFKVIGKENVKDKGRLIVCANHTHILDPLVLAAAMNRTIYFMAKKELFSGLLKPIISHLHAIPVNRDGNDSVSLKIALKTLKEEHVLGIFPEGTRSENDKMNFKPGVGMLSIKTKTQILPVYIRGNYKIFGKIDLIFGEPYELSLYYDRKLTGEDYERIANETIAESVRALKKRLPQQMKSRQ